MEETGGFQLFPKGTYFFKVRGGENKPQKFVSGSTRKYVIKFFAKSINNPGDYDKRYTQNFFPWTVNELVSVALNIKPDKEGKLKWELDSIVDTEVIADIDHIPSRKNPNNLWAQMINIRTIDQLNPIPQKPVTEEKIEDEKINIEDIPF